MSPCYTPLSEAQLAVLDRLLTEEDNFYDAVIKPDGAYWDHAFLIGFLALDGGLENAVTLYDNISDHFDRLKEITDREAGLMPVMKQEQAVMEKLATTHLQPVGQLLNQVPDHVKERGRVMLTEEEFADVADWLGSLRIYMAYRDGRNLLMLAHFKDGTPISEVVKEYWIENQRFERTWNEKYYLQPDRKVFNMTTFFAVDAHDNTLVPDVLVREKLGREGDVTELLLTETPRRGVEQVILRDNKKKIRSIVKERHPRDGICTANNLRKRLKRARVRRYNERVGRILSGGDVGGPLA